jgi:GT2 family glycosyltransferase
MSEPSAAIDIVIVNYRGMDDTLVALQRLGEWPHGTVWVVDNSASEADQAMASQLLREGVARHPFARLLATEHNIGFGRACNLAFAQSSAPHFLLLNPDARITAHNVLQLGRTLDEQPRLAAVSPKIYWNAERSFVQPSAFPQTPGASLSLAWASRAPARAQLAARRYLDGMVRSMQSTEPVEVDFVAGSVLLLRRSAVLTAGGLFDPGYFMFFEDADLSRRLRRRGHSLAVDPAATAVHEYRHKPFKEALMAQSQQLFFRKQYPLFHRLSGQLRRVQALAKPMEPAAWFHLLPRPTPHAQAFTEQTQDAAVLAFSPSLLMRPCIFRPEPAKATPFSQAEWGLLEPGSYVALLQSAASSSPPLQWTLFQR